MTGSYGACQVFVPHGDGVISEFPRARSAARARAWRLHPVASHCARQPRRPGVLGARGSCDLVTGWCRTDPTAPAAAAAAAREGVRDPRPPLFAAVREEGSGGVGEGIRPPDFQNHNLAL